MGPPSHRTPPLGGAFSRRFTRYSGFFFDEFAPDSAWIREVGWAKLPPLSAVGEIVIRGEFRPHPSVRGIESGPLGLTFSADGATVGSLQGLKPGPWEVRFPVAAAEDRPGPVLGIRLTGVAFTNALAWLGRVSGLGLLQRFRGQSRNHQIRIRSIETGDGLKIYDFSKREAPYSVAFARRHTRVGMNIAGFLTADLGIGESARCMVRAADAAGIPTALIALRLNCKNPRGDMTFASRLQETNPFGVNVIHVDPPAARDIDHHHGAAFRRGKYNIGYFAWELPEFPDAWVGAFDSFDEIWCPSEFCGAAIALKSPLPVLTMPHAISFERPRIERSLTRARFGLPPDDFIFLSLFDLNSYSARKNPRGAIEAFRRSGLAGRGAALVIKVHNAAANPDDFATLQEAIRDLPSAILLSDTLPRAEVYALEAACDSFVSLHRSEGFGLAVAECMHLGLPVIATDWSATAEYLNAQNGCPVRCAPIVLDRHHGPYTQGSTWAEPDLDHAAEWMRRLVADRGLGSALGEAAQHTIAERFAPAVIGARYRRRLESVTGF